MNFFKKLFAPKLQPENYYQTTITDTLIRVEHPKRETEKILWRDIKEIKLINTDAGPATPDIWLALLGENSGCLIPHGSKGFDKVYEIISKYENFNFENVTKSMASTSNEHFLLWKSPSKKIAAMVFIDDEKIGYSNFEIIDQSMGAIGGFFNASENYQKFRNRIVELYSKKGSANSEDFNFRILVNNDELIVEGGICLTDNGEDEIYIDVAGIDIRHFLIKPPLALVCNECLLTLKNK